MESGNGELTVKWNGHQFELGMRSLAIKKAKKSEKNITITTASGFEPRTLNPLVLCGRYPDELPLLRLPLISHFMLLAFAVYIRKHSGRLGK